MGGDTNGPLAVAVIGGMITSTLLTLVVVPSVYSLVERRKEREGQHRLLATITTMVNNAMKRAA